MRKSKNSRRPRLCLTARIERARNYCAWGLGLSAALLAAACDHPVDSPGKKDMDCGILQGALAASYPAIGCMEDYRALAARPYDESMPGAFAVKVLVDRADGNRVHFLDSRKYRLHYDFALENLSGNGLPPVRSMADFVSEYHAPDRRFVLGTLARYDRPGNWTWELTPSDNAGADLIAMAHERIAEVCFCGKDLYFHATSLDIEAEAGKLPASIKVLTTAKVYAGIDYQALNFAEAIGRLTFTTSAKLRTGYAGPRDVLVLDSVPDGVGLAVAGLITREFQTPLSHANVLAQDRGIPNMGLRGALTDTALRAREGKWVKLKVGAFEYSITEASQAEADAWWASRKPSAAPVPALDTTATELQDVEKILDESLALREAVRKAVPAYGGRAAHYAAFARMDRAKVAYEPAFAIPVRYYLEHMRRNGLNDSVDNMLADSAFSADPAERDRRLKNLREAIVNAPFDPGFRKLLGEKLDAKFPGSERISFVASTNAGDLDSLAEAGIYASRIGGRSDPAHPLARALPELWAGTWDLAAFEERSVRGIDHKSVGMGALAQAVVAGVKANGAAITKNPFDAPNYEPGFYVNAQAGDASVTRPAPGAVSDQFLYHYSIIGQPIVVLTRSHLTALGTTVLTKVQTYALGTALKEIDGHFIPPEFTTLANWHGMRVEFILGQRAGVAVGAEPVIIVTSVRPYGGWR